MLLTIFYKHLMLLIKDDPFFIQVGHFKDTFNFYVFESPSFYYLLYRDVDTGNVIVKFFNKETREYRWKRTYKSPFFKDIYKGIKRDVRKLEWMLYKKMEIELEDE